MNFKLLKISLLTRMPKMEFELTQLGLFPIGIPNILWMLWHAQKRVLVRWNVSGGQGGKHFLCKK